MTKILGIDTGTNSLGWAIVEKSRIEGGVVMAVLNITKDNFQQEVVAASQTVLVDFWATWCGPCQMMGPILEELATKHPEIKVGKINVDEQPELAMQFQIDAIPALMVFKGGKAVAQTVGLQPIENLEQLL